MKKITTSKTAFFMFYEITKYLDTKKIAEIQIKNYKGKLN